MTRGWTRHPSRAGRLLDGALEDGLVKMMAAPLAGRSIDVEPGRGKDPLPRPFARRPWILRAKRAGQRDMPAASRQVRLVLRLDVPQVIDKRPLQPGRQHRHAVLAALAVADRQL